jgi:hypothetical protein
MPRPPSKKAHVFNLPARHQTKQTPAPTPTPKVAPLTFEIDDHESGYAIGAMVDAQRHAAAQQAACEAAGDLTQSIVFAQKAAALHSIAMRMLKAFKERQR